MAGTGGRVLGAGLADDILVDLGPLTLVVAPAAKEQALGLSRVWYDFPTCDTKFEGTLQTHFPKEINVCFTHFLLRHAEDSHLGKD